MPSCGLGLLKCNQVLRIESSEIFYQRNTFCFRGGSSWVSLLGFLHCIGERNQRYLRNLVIDFAQNSHGFLSPPWAPTLPPRHHFEPLGGIEKSLYPTEDSETAIGTCFQMIGGKGPALSLTVDLGFERLPNLSDRTPRLNSRPFQSPMDLQDLIQQSSQFHGRGRIVLS